MKLNIALLAATSTAALHVKNPAGELLFADAERTLPVRILVHGPGSKAYGVVESRQSARMLKRMQDNDGKMTASNPEERVSETAEDLAAITSAFENFEYKPESAAEPVTGEDLFRSVYANPSLGFITRQVQKFVSDWGNFTAASKAA